MPWADILIIILEFLSNRLKDNYAIFGVRAVSYTHLDVYKRQGDFKRLYERNFVENRPETIH